MTGITPRPELPRVTLQLQLNKSKSKIKFTTIWQQLDFERSHLKMTAKEGSVGISRGIGRAASNS